MEQEEVNDIPVRQGRVKRVYPQRNLPTYEEMQTNGVLSWYNPELGAIKENPEGDYYSTPKMDRSASTLDDFEDKRDLSEFEDYHTDNYGNVLPFSTRDKTEDLEDERAENSNAAWNLTKSAGRFLGKTALYTVGGIAGGLEGAAEWAVEEIGDAITGNKVSDGFRNLYDNVVNNAVLAGDKWIDENIQVYKTKEYQESNFFSKMLNPTMFIDDLASQAAFTSGAVLSTMATGGLGLTSNVAKGVGLMGKLLDKTSKLQKLLGIVEGGANLGKTTSFVKNAFIGSQFEAAFEALNAGNEMRQTGLEKLAQRYGGEDKIPEWEKDYLEKSITDAGNMIYAGNLALLQVSNRLQMPKIFGGKAAGVAEPSKFNTVKNILKNGFWEGAEETSQSVLSGTAVDYAKAMYDPETNDKADAFRNALTSNISKQFTKEGFNEFMAGAFGGIIGAPNLKGIYNKVKYAGKDVDKDGNPINKDMWAGGIPEALREHNENAEKYHAANANLDDILAKTKDISQAYQKDQQDGLNLYSQIIAKEKPEIFADQAAKNEMLVREAANNDKLSKAEDMFTIKGLHDESRHNLIKAHIEAGKTKLLLKAIDDYAKLPANREEEDKLTNGNAVGENFQDRFIHPEIAAKLYPNGITKEQQAKEIKKMKDKVKSLETIYEKVDKFLPSRQFDKYTSPEDKINNKIRRDALIYALSQAENIDKRIENLTKELDNKKFDASSIVSAAEDYANGKMSHEEYNAIIDKANEDIKPRLNIDKPELYEGINDLQRLVKKRKELIREANALTNKQEDYVKQAKDKVNKVETPVKPEGDDLGKKAEKVNNVSTVSTPPEPTLFDQQLSEDDVDLTNTQVKTVEESEGSYEEEDGINLLNLAQEDSDKLYTEESNTTQKETELEKINKEEKEEIIKQIKAAKSIFGLTDEQIKDINKIDFTQTKTIQGQNIAGLQANAVGLVNEIINKIQQKYQQKRDELSKSTETEEVKYSATDELVKLFKEVGLNTENDNIVNYSLKELEEFNDKINSIITGYIANNYDNIDPKVIKALEEELDLLDRRISYLIGKEEATKDNKPAYVRTSTILYGLTENSWKEDKDKATAEQLEAAIFEVDERGDKIDENDVKNYRALVPTVPTRLKEKVVYSIRKSNSIIIKAFIDGEYKPITRIFDHDRFYVAIEWKGNTPTKFRKLNPFDISDLEIMNGNFVNDGVITNSGLNFQELYKGLTTAYNNMLQASDKTVKANLIIAKEIENEKYNLPIGKLMQFDEKGHLVFWESGRRSAGGSVLHIALGNKEFLPGTPSYNKYKAIIDNVTAKLGDKYKDIKDNNRVILRKPDGVLELGTLTYPTFSNFESFRDRVLKLYDNFNKEEASKLAKDTESELYFTSQTEGTDGVQYNIEFYPEGIKITNDKTKKHYILGSVEVGKDKDGHSILGLDKAKLESILKDKDSLLKSMNNLKTGFKMQNIQFRTNHEGTPIPNENSILKLKPVIKDIKTNPAKDIVDTTTKKVDSLPEEKKSLIMSVEDFDKSTEVEDFGNDNEGFLVSKGHYNIPFTKRIANLKNIINISDSDVFELQEIAGRVIKEGYNLQGSYSNFVMKVASKAVKGTEYHEAFHAIIRTFFNDEQLLDIFNEAGKKYKVTRGEINNLVKERGLDITKYSDKQLVIFVLEEKLAESFRKYQNNKSSIVGKIKGFFSKIFKFTGLLNKNKGIIATLFDDISDGVYATKTKADRQFNMLLEGTANLVLLSKDSSNRTISIHSQDTERLISMIMCKAAFEEDINGKRTIKPVNETMINEAIDETIEYYHINNWTDELTALSITNPDKAKDIIQILRERIIALKNEKNRKIIIDEITKRLEVFKITDDENADENDNLENEEGGSFLDNYSTSAVEKGGLQSSTKNMKVYISTTQYSNDEFGFGISEDELVDNSKYKIPVNLFTTYDVLVRSLADTSKEKFIERLEALSLDNSQIRALKERFFQDIGYNGVLDYSVKSNTMFNEFRRNFNKYTASMYQHLYDGGSGRYKGFLANQNNVDHVQKARWARNYKDIRDNKGYNYFREGIEEIFPLDSDMAFVSEQNLNKAVDRIQNAYKKIGIELSKAYIKYSIADLYKEDEIALEEPFMQELLKFYKAFEGTDGLYTIIKGSTRAESPATVIKKHILNTNYDNTGLDLFSGNIEAPNGKLSMVANGNAIFDENVGSTTFRNAEGKTIYDKLLPNYAITETLDWQDRKDIIKAIQKKDYELAKFLFVKEMGDRYDPYLVNEMFEFIKTNPLFKYNVDALFDKGFRLNFISGFRETELDEDLKEVKKSDFSKNKDGESYGNMDLRSRILNMILLYTENKDQHKKTNKVTIPTSKYIIGVNSDKNLTYIMDLPRETRYTEGNVTKETNDDLFTLFKQEFDRITRARKDENNPDRLILKNYNEGQGRAFDFFNFKFLSDELKDLQDKQDKFEKKNPELPKRRKYIDYTQLKEAANKGKLTPEIEADVREALDSYFKKDIDKFIDVLKEAGLIDKIRVSRYEQIWDETIFNQETQKWGAYRDDVTKFIDFEEIYTNLLLPVEFGDRTIYDNKDNYVIRHGNFNYEYLANFYYNDLIASMSFNQLTDYDDAFSFKSPVDKVKRNGGKVANGSVSNGTETSVGIILDDDIEYCNPEVAKTPEDRVILAEYESAVDKKAYLKELNLKGGDKSVEPDEVKKEYAKKLKVLKSYKITRTDGQTYWHSRMYEVNYLLPNAKLSKEVKDVYKKVHRMTPLTLEEYEILHENAALANPRKTAGRDAINYNKTSVFMLNRYLCSIKKDNVSDEEYNDKFDALDEMYDKHYSNGSISMDEIQRFYVNQIHPMLEALPGKEAQQLHKMMNNMEAHGVDFAEYISASKQASVLPSEYNNDEWEFNPFTISNRNTIEQVNTDKHESKITHPTQLMQLIWSEQNATTPIKYNGVNTNVGELRRTYLNLLAKRTLKGTKAKLQELIDKDDNVNWALLGEVFNNSLDASGADVSLKELMALNADGSPKYNWNIQSIEYKTQQLFLSWFSKGSIKHKSKGEKFTLVNDHFIPVYEYLGKILRRQDLHKLNSAERAKVTTRRLRHAISDGNGGFYSECIISHKDRTTYNLKPGDIIPPAIAEMMGVRIPTQDKQSMITLKVVDFLPIEYGNAMVLPAETVYLAGEDFDIDSKYARQYEYYGNYNKYGSYLDADNLKDSITWGLDELYISTYKNSRELKELVKETIANDSRIIALKADMDKIAANKSYLKQTVNAIKSRLNAPKVGDLVEATYQEVADNTLLEATKYNLQLEAAALRDVSKDLDRITEEIKRSTIDSNVDTTSWVKNITDNYNLFKENKISDINPLTLEELNNHLLSVERVLVRNNGNIVQANSPASMDIFHDTLAQHKKEYGLIDNREVKGSNSITDKIKLTINNFVGKANIGPGALLNSMFQLLHIHNISLNRVIYSSGELQGKRIFPPILGQYDGYGVSNDNIKLVDSRIENNDKLRINDLISSFISAATDNAKEQWAALFNITPETVWEAVNMVMNGVSFSDTLKLLQNSAVKAYTRKLAIKNAPVKTIAELKETRDELLNNLKREQGLIGANTNNISIKDITDVLAFERGVLKDSEGNLKELDPLYVKRVNAYALDEFVKVKQYTDNIKQLSSVLSLIKGFKPNFADVSRIDTALETLGLKIALEGENLVFSNIKGVFPYNLKNVLRTPYIEANLKAYLELKKVAGRVFIGETNLAKEMLATIEESLKPGSFNFKENFKNLREDVITFLSMKAFRHSNKWKISVTDLFDSKLVDVVNFIKKQDNYKNNKFVQSLTTTSTTYEDGLFVGKKQYFVNINVPTKDNPNLQQEIRNGFGNLMTDEQEYEYGGGKVKGRTIALELYKYLVVKDNLTFKQDSFITKIDTTSFNSLSKVLDAVLDTANGYENFVDTFGVSKKELINEFDELVARNVEYSNLISYLPTTLYRIRKGSENKFVINVPTEGNPTYEAWKNSGMFIDKDKKLKFPKYLTSNGNIYKLDVKNDIERIATYIKVEKIGNKNIMPYWNTVSEWNNIISQFKGGVTNVSTIPNNTISDRIFNYVNELVPRYLRTNNDKIRLVSEFKALQTLSIEPNSIEELIKGKKQAEEALQSYKDGELSLEPHLDNIIANIVLGKFAEDGISESDIWNNLFNINIPTPNIVTPIKEIETPTAKEVNKYDYYVDTNNNHEIIILTKSNNISFVQDLETNERYEINNTEIKGINYKTSSIGTNDLELNGLEVYNQFPNKIKDIVNKLNLVKYFTVDYKNEINVISSWLDSLLDDNITEKEKNTIINYRNSLDNVNDDSVKGNIVNTITSKVGLDKKEAVEKWYDKLEDVDKQKLSSLDINNLHKEWINSGKNTKFSEFLEVELTKHCK